MEPATHRVGRRSARARVAAWILVGVGVVGAVGGAVAWWKSRRVWPEGEWLEAKLHVIVLSDDDGSNPATPEVDEIVAAVEFANAVWAPAKIRLVLDPVNDIESLPDSKLNAMSGRGAKNWAWVKTRANSLARQHPDAITVFYRNGLPGKPALQAFSSWEFDFVVLPSPKEHQQCGLHRTDALAHELGHYLGLRHTFRGGRPATIAQGEEMIRDEGLTAKSFDGDGLGDTAPDPAVKELECDPPRSLELADIHFDPPTDNIMSYYRGRNAITPQQAVRARWILSYRQEHGMRFYPNELPEQATEAEVVPFEVEGDCTPEVRDAPASRQHGWSGGKYLDFDGSAGCRVRLDIPVPATGQYRVRVWATMRRNAASLSASVEGDEPVVFELWSPVTAPSGPLDLGVHPLTRGTLALTLEASPSTTTPRRGRIGVDAVELVRVPSSGAPAID